MTVNELIEALTDAVESDEAIGERELCIGIITQRRITRAEINDTAEVFYTEFSGEQEGEERFWLTVSDDRDNFYNTPEDLREQYR
jgi:hypothetical protein